MHFSKLCLGEKIEKLSSAKVAGSVRDSVGEKRNGNIYATFTVIWRIRSESFARNRAKAVN